MRVVNIHEAKTQLSRLVREAAAGESFVIARAGKPLVKVVPLSARPEPKRRRLGSLRGRFKVPDNFDRMAQREIEEMFGLQE